MLIAVSLYYWGDDLDPDAITNALGIKPTKSAVKGRSETTCTGRNVVRRTGLWCLSSDSLSTSIKLDDHIDILVQTLGRQCRLDLLKQFPNVDDACIDIFISDVESTNPDSGCQFEISPSSTRLLSEIGLPLRFAIPFPTARDQIE